MQNLDSCKICGNNLFKIGAESRDYDSPSNKFYRFYECKICGLFQQNPIPDLNEIKTFYPSNYSGNYVEGVGNDKKIKSKLKNFLNLFYKEHLTLHKKEISYILNYKQLKNLNNLDILDVGCGNGPFLIPLSKYNFNLYGVDMDEDVINFLRDSYSINGEVCSFEDFKTSLKFDVIYLAHFLEHATDPIKIIQKAKKLLKKGGILIVRVPNINSLSFKIFKNYCYILDLPRHLFMFSPKTLDNILNLSGFEKNEIKLNKINSDFISILNFLGFGDIRSKVVTSFGNRLIFFSLSLIPSFLLWLIFLPFYIFYEGEEIVSISTN